MSPTPIYYPDDDELNLATAWHGGQATMLYAVASTGHLQRGTVRPHGYETIDEWELDLAERLRREVAEVVAYTAPGETTADPFDHEIASTWLVRLDELIDELCGEDDDVHHEGDCPVRGDR